jgi:type II secretory pathway pseudopilin PulG
MYPKVFRIKAVTLIELIFAMVILGIAVTAMMGALGTVSRNATFSEDTARLSFFSESLMEDIMGKQFDNNGANCAANISNCTLPAALGREDVNYNDIDDYNNYADIPANGFVRSANVAYASLNANNVWQANYTSRTDQKIVTVTANRARGSYKVTLTGMKSRCPGN